MTKAKNHQHPVMKVTKTILEIQNWIRKLRIQAELYLFSERIFTKLGQLPS